LRVRVGIHEPVDLLGGFGQKIFEAAGTQLVLLERDPSDAAMIASILHRSKARAAFSA
jgi:hypothetical protein